tara:strand:+ start:421 stop:540 length:120 start_codon:yes stop_codon:yes gene_type:complete
MIKKLLRRYKFWRATRAEAKSIALEKKAKKLFNEVTEWI